VFRPIFAEELRRRLASPVTWILWLGLCAYTAAAMLGGQTEELAGGGVPHNGSFVIYYWCMYSGFWVAVLGPALFAHPLLRDLRLRIAPLVASKPISAGSYFWGKYLANALTASVVLLSIPATIVVLPVFVRLLGLQGLYLLPYTPWSHISLATLVWVLPAVFVYGSLHFASAALTGRVYFSYGFAVLSMAVFTMFFVSFQSDSAHHFWIEVVDPMGKQTLDGQALLWTIPARATHFLEATPALILNRFIYVVFAGAVLGFAAMRFQFSRFLFQRTRVKKTGSGPMASRPGRLSWSAMARGNPAASVSASARLAIELGLQNYLASWASPVFRAVLAALVMIAVTAGWGAVAPAYNTPDHQLLPAAQYLLTVIQPQMFMLLIMVMVYYAGEIAARDVDTRLSGVIDSTPTSTAVLATGKWLAIAILALVLCVLPAIAVVILQLLSGYIEKTPSLFARGAVLHILPYLFAYGSLSFGIYGLSRNRLASQAIPMVGLWAGVALHESGVVEQRMALLGPPPEMLFSDIGILDTSTLRHLLFDGYYLGITTLVGVLGLMAWSRGALKPLRKRLWAGMTTGVVVAGLGSILVTGGAATAIYEALYISNDTKTVAQSYDEASDYEKRFGMVADQPQPAIRALTLDARIDPIHRRVSYRGLWHLANEGAAPITAIWLNLPEDSTLDQVWMNEERTKPAQFDKRQRVARFLLSRPMQVGERMEFRFELTTRHRGFTYDIFLGRLERESTVLSEADLPVIGYDRARELEPAIQRSNHGLGPRKQILEDTTRFARHANAGAADITLKVSAPSDLRIAATGDLISERTQGGWRNAIFIARNTPLHFLIALGPLAKATSNQEPSPVGPTVSVSYVPLHDANVTAIIERATKWSGRYASRFGAPAFRTVQVAEVGQFREGDDLMEPDAAGNLVIVPERFGWLHDYRTPPKRDYLTFLLGSQLAKAWWGGTVASRQGPGAALVDEGVPILLGLEAVAAQHGEAAAQDYAGVLRDRVRLLIARADAPRVAILKTQFELYAGLQAGLALFDLRQTLGEERFDRALDAFYRQHRHGAPVAPADLAHTLGLPV